MHLPTAAIIVLSATLASTSASSDTPEPATSDDLRIVLDSLEGCWTGTLEYWDYGRDDRTELPAGLTHEAFSTELTARRAFAFQDPGRVVKTGELARFDVDSQTVTIIPAEGDIASLRSGIQQWRIESCVIESPASWKMTLVANGSDDNRPALMRMTQALESGVLSATKEVDYTDDADTTGEPGSQFQFRNAIQMKRVKDDASTLVGTWQIDLRPTPDAEPYFAELVIARGEIDGSLSGTFYGGSPIQYVEVNTDWFGVHFAFTTSDNSGTYHTSGTLRDGRISGTTHSLGRRFLAFWRGTRSR